MQRQIKFRAWHTVKEKMYSWEYIKNTYTIHALSDENVVQLKFMQYTGLKDRHGAEIYEGDIVRFTYWWFDGNEAESELIGSVVYIQEHASYGLEGVKNTEWIKHIGGEDGSSDTSPFANWTFSSDDIEVIGNIYEHSHLLENESKKTR